MKYTTSAPTIALMELMPQSTLQLRIAPMGGSVALRNYRQSTKWS